MSSNNNINIVGNVVRDPELRFTPTGAATATFGVAVNEKWQNKQTNQWEESTSFFDVVCWKDLAEHVSECISKGTRVIVAGKLKQRSWETAEKEKRSKIEIVADEVGPSLRWATANVQKAQRDQGDNSQRPVTSGYVANSTDWEDGEPF